MFTIIINIWNISISIHLLLHTILPLKIECPDATKTKESVTYPVFYTSVLRVEVI